MSQEFEYAYLMNLIWKNLKKFQDDPAQEKLYEAVLNDLDRLYEMIESNQVPNDVYVDTLKFYNHCYRKVGSLKYDYELAKKKQK